MSRWKSRDEFDPMGLIQTKTLEVENISEETTPKDLHRLFAKYGVVLSVAIDAGYESDFLRNRDPESDEAIESDEVVESDKVIGPDKVIGRVIMLEDDAAIADKNLHGRRWRGRKLKVRLQRNPWASTRDFED